MLNSVTSLRFLLLILTLGLFACSSGGGGSDNPDPDPDPVEEVPVAPVFTSIISSDSRVDLNWIHVDEPSDDVDDGAPILRYNLYYAKASDADTTIADLAVNYTTVADIEAVPDFQVVEDIAALEYSVTDLDNLSLYFFILTAINEEGEGDSSANEAYAMPRASLVSAQPLNDTGFTLCGDYTFGVDAQDLDGDGVISAAEIDLDEDGEFLEHDNGIDCSSVSIDGDLGIDVDDERDPIPALAQQDAMQGLDMAPVDDGDGIAGFSFTKLDDNGDALAADSDTWSCVQDNVTGLVWEAKTDIAENLHYSKDRFTWYNNDTTVNGEQEGYELPSGFAGNDTADDDSCFGYTENDPLTYCNTSAFVERVNTENLCNLGNWRLPSLIEVRSLVNYGTLNDNVDALVASVDLEYFPNTEIDGGIEGTTIDGGIWHWSADTYAAAPNAAWALYFGFGGAPILDKGSLNVVRLVSNGP